MLQLLKLELLLLKLRFLYLSCLLINTQDLPDFVNILTNILSNLMLKSFEKNSFKVYFTDEFPGSLSSSYKDLLGLSGLDFS